MTMANNTPATMDSWDANLGTGLEDFDTSDASIPRLTIDHIDAVFKDSQTEETFQTLDCILLGLVKQRLMWPAEQADGESKDSPLCKSPDFKHGFPNMDSELPKDKQFPWGASNYTKENLFAVEGTDLPALACNTCRFKEWNSDPSGNKPWCSEEWVLPLLYWNNDQWNPAIISFHRSSLKSVKKYISAFATRKLPLFTAVTTLSLTQNKRGMVRYCIPNFARKGESNSGEWMDYRTDFLGIEEYLRAFPQAFKEDGDSDGAVAENVSGNNWDSGNVIDAEVEPEAPAAPSNPAPAQPAAPAQPTPPPSAPAAPSQPTPPQAPAAAADDDDDEPPF